MKIPLRIHLFAVLVAVILCTSLAGARTLRLFTVGNSFSNNATRYLPDLAKAGGHELIIGKAAKGGGSLLQHWEAIEAWRANPDDPKAKIYSGKSLQEQLGTGTWDVITIQQYSLHSADPTTYRPYAQKLQAHLKGLQPGAEIVWHQTWAYRVDADKFAQIAPGKNAASQLEMYERSRAAYRQMAAELGLRLIPAGDAFWQVNSDPMWTYRPDETFNPKTAVRPVLPTQTHSLHVGYRWSPEGKLGKDANHANVAGEYLGALVWYVFLFNESPESLAFVPPGVSPEFAAHLRKIAWKVVQEAAPENAHRVGKSGRESPR